jgi:hypothetical protein
MLLYVYVDQVGQVTATQVVQDGGLIEFGHLRHILRPVVPPRIGLLECGNVSGLSVLLGDGFGSAFDELGEDEAVLVVLEPDQVALQDAGGAFVGADRLGSEIALHHSRIGALTNRWHIDLCCVRANGDQC